MTVHTNEEKESSMAEYDVVEIGDTLDNELEENSVQNDGAVVPITIRMANRIASQLLREIDDDETRNDTAMKKELISLIDRVVLQDNPSGDMDDFHNLAVELARFDEYDLTCRVLQRALDYYPNEVDLLADFIQYGTKCGRFVQSDEYYKRLIKIPKSRWTWRGFVFSVEYLLILVKSAGKNDSAIKQSERKMLDIAHQYREYFPDNEEPYNLEARIYRSIRSNTKPNREESVLEEALKKIKVCPKCALRYADIMFEKGEYSIAMDTITKCVTMANQTQASINEAYLNYLQGLCRVALLLTNENKENEAEVLHVYTDFNLALKSFKFNNEYKEVIRTKTNSLIAKYNVYVPEENEELIELIS